MKATKLDKEIQQELYDPDPETQGKMKGFLHMAIDKLFDPKSKRWYIAGDEKGLLAHLTKEEAKKQADRLQKVGMKAKVVRAKAGGYNVMVQSVFNPEVKAKKGTLKITGDKPKLTKLKKHLEKEHPSTKGHMKVLDPEQYSQTFFNETIRQWTNQYIESGKNPVSAQKLALKRYERIYGKTTYPLPPLSDEAKRYLDPITKEQKELSAKLKSYGLSNKEVVYYLIHPSKLKAEDLIRIAKQRRVLYDPNSRQVKYGHFVIEEDRMGNITLWHSYSAKSAFFQSEADKEAVYELLKKDEKESLESGWAIDVYDNEPRASVLQELFEVSSTEDVYDPKKPANILTEKQLRCLYQEYVNYFYSGAIHGDRPMTYEHWKQARDKYYDPKKPAEIYVVTDSRGNKHKASYAEWLKWMKEQAKRMYDPKAKYQIGDKVHLKGHGMVKVLGVRESLGRIMYRVSFPKTGLKPREYDEFDLDYKYSKENLEARKEAGLPYDPKKASKMQMLGYARRHAEVKDPYKTVPRWYEAMVKGIKKRSDVMNPYAIVKNIWARLKPSKRAEIKAREAKGEVFHYDLPLPKDVDTKGIGTLRMVKPFKLAEAQVNVSAKDMKEVKKSGIFKPMKRQDGTTAQVARCKSNTPVNIFVDEV